MPLTRAEHQAPDDQQIEFAAGDCKQEVIVSAHLFIHDEPACHLLSVGKERLQRTAFVFTLNVIPRTSTKS